MNTLARRVLAGVMIGAVLLTLRLVVDALGLWDL